MKLLRFDKIIGEIPKDMKEIKKLFKLAEHGNGSCLFQIATDAQGVIHAKGLLIPRDYDKVFKYFHRLWKEAEDVASK